MKFDKAQLVKVDEELGLVFGWAIVSTIGGEPYYDSQGDHIPEGSMLKAATEFMEKSRDAREMHRGSSKGSVVFAFPLTKDLADALGVRSEQTGLLIAMKPEPELLEKFKDGTYTGFSIGGEYGEVEEVTP